jgi:hypothetical protein
LDQPFLHEIQTDQFNASRALGKSPGEVFMVDHDIAKGLAPNQLGVKVRLVETCQGTSPDLCVPIGQQGAAQFKLLGVRRVGTEPGVHILGVLGIKLTLDDHFR